MYTYILLEFNYFATASRITSVVLCDSKTSNLARHYVLNIRRHQTLIMECVAINFNFRPSLMFVKLKWNCTASFDQFCNGIAKCCLTRIMSTHMASVLLIIIYLQGVLQLTCLPLSPDLSLIKHLWTISYTFCEISYNA